MNIEIKKYDQENASVCNDLLTKLINDETKYDENLKINIIINDYYNKLNENSVIYIAFINNKVVGYIYGYVAEDILVKEKTAKLDALYVIEEYRGNKIASKLIEEYKNWCFSKEVKYIEVTAWNDNIDATKIYLKQDFIPKKTTYIYGCPKKQYQKLVRDKIPEKIKNNNEEPITRILDEKEFKEELEKKLYEEYIEVISAKGEEKLEELADMLEVISALAKSENKTLDDIINIANNKKNKRGAFNDKIFLEGIK